MLSGEGVSQWNDINTPASVTVTVVVVVYEAKATQDPDNNNCIIIIIICQRSWHTQGSIINLVWIGFLFVSFRFVLFVCSIYLLLSSSLKKWKFFQWEIFFFNANLWVYKTLDRFWNFVWKVKYFIIIILIVRAKKKNRTYPFFFRIEFFIIVVSKWKFHENEIPEQTKKKFTEKMFKNLIKFKIF